MDSARKMCEDCAHFHGKQYSRCALADTVVGPQDWCHLWTPTDRKIGVERPSERRKKLP